MNRSQILAAIRGLACSQGFYGRLYNALTSGSDEAEEYLQILESQNFRDTLTLVLYIES